MCPQHGTTRPGVVARAGQAPTGFMVMLGITADTRIRDLYAGQRAQIRDAVTALNRRGSSPTGDGSSEQFRVHFSLCQDSNGTRRSSVQWNG